MRIRNRNIITICLMIFDAVAIAFSYFFGLWLRFDFHYSDIPVEYLHEYAYFIPFCIIFSIILFYLMGLYRSIWSFVGFHELLRYMGASLVSSLLHCFFITLILGRMPMSYYIVGTVIQLFLISSVRFSYRIYREIFKRRNRAATESSVKRIMIIGGGLAGRIVIKELLQTDKLDCVPCCVIDDNPYKRGRSIEGVPIVGDRDTIITNAERYNIDEIYFCIPSASSEVKKEILIICNETGCEMKSLPGIYQIANDEITVSNMRPVALEDLLGRSQVKVNMDEIYDEIKGETILITGAGGSIGSELARQVAAHDPFHLILFDIYENTTYAVELELREKYPNLKLTVLIGSVRDSRRVNQIFETYHPDVVYHAAAHKHVPLMEYNPDEAIKNNVIGTYKTAYAALKYGARRFVLISTDTPTNHIIDMFRYI